ncbi:MAG: FliG C-terminal domain-containing protein [Pseudomonadota bacterium]
MPSTELAQLSSAAPVTARPVRAHAVAGRLTRRQKAAIIVRYLINQGAQVPLTDLPETLQEVLTTQMGSMRYVDRDTLADVLAEFAAEIEATGLTFPRGVAGALTALDGQISPQTAIRLRKEAGVRQFGDPWGQVCAAKPEQLKSILISESAEVAAILLSKLSVTKAADLLGDIPGDRARRITYAVSQTSDATPEAVDRIGLALAAQLQDAPQVAFEETPDARVGAILNYSQAAIRDDVLEGLDETDQDFATLVRRAIFTFENIPDRIFEKDIPTVARDMPQDDLVTALAGGLQGGEALAIAAEFILENMSKRMSEALRDEIGERGTISDKNAEEAMTELINNIRALEAGGEIKFRPPDE